MTTVGFHASHEQTPPERASSPPCGAPRRPASTRRCARTTSRRGACGRASRASPGPGSAPRCRRPRCSLGVVNAPGQRYHPAIVAQAIAHPRARCSPAGSGRRSAAARRCNEHVTGDPLAAKDDRDARLPRVRRRHPPRCSRGEEVTHDGLVRVDRARVWSRPDEPPPLLGAAVSAETARWVAAWADGLDHRRPAAATRSATVDRRLPRRRRPRARARCRCTSLGADGRRGPRDRPRPVAHGRRARRRWPGTSSSPRRSTTRRAAPPAERGAPRRCSSPPTPASTPTGSPSSPSSASTAIYLHHVGTDQDAFIDAFGERRCSPRLQEVG